MKIRRRFGMVFVLALAAILSLSGCQKKTAEKSKESKTEGQTQPIETKEKSAEKDTAEKAKDGGVVMTEAEMEKAQKRAEAFMKKHGADLIERLANQQVQFFRTNLARGDALFKEKKFSQAVAAYRDSLATKPNDARTLLSISRAAFAGSDLDTARVTGLLGIHRAYDPRIRSGILTLLGDIAVKQGDKRLALFYYTSAREAFDNPTLGTTISKLKGEVKAPLAKGQSFIGGQLAPIGPVADLPALCQELERHIPKDTRGIKCDPGTATTISAPTGSTFKEAAYLPVVSAETEQHYVLAGRSDAGWFALTELAQVSQIVSLYSPGDKFKVTQFEFQQLIPGGPHELLLAFTHGVEDADPGINEVERQVAGTLLICGQKDGQLQCMQRIPTLLKRERGVLSTQAEAVVKPAERLGKLPIKESFTFSIDLSKPGKVVVSSKTPPAKKFKKLIGTINL